MIFELVEGWTGPITVQLLEDGSPADLTGMTVSLILKTKDGRTVSTTSTSEVTVTGSTDGRVVVRPTAADLKAIHSPYSARFKSVDGSSGVVYYPSGKADLWHVYNP